MKACLRALGILRYFEVPDLQDLFSDEQCMAAHQKLPTGG
jgi:hypothetical protein